MIRPTKRLVERPSDDVLDARNDRREQSGNQPPSLTVTVRFEELPQRFPSRAKFVEKFRCNLTNGLRFSAELAEVVAILNIRLFGSRVGPLNDFLAGTSVASTDAVTSRLCQ